MRSTYPQWYQYKKTLCLKWSECKFLCAKWCCLKVSSANRARCKTQGIPLLPLQALSTTCQSINMLSVEALLCALCVRFDCNLFIVL
uniref:Uncharacterized protein n=1 Tax=Picea glauca TaxID=3330 RepID=A0A101LWB2_PICGL|nr:hypothetical protein ABT39_MTgene1627 [Picea glauca]